MRVTVDLDLCQGHARCQDRCPEVFSTDEVEGKCVVLLERVPPALQHKARLGMLNCPENAITLLSDPGDVA